MGFLCLLCEEQFIFMDSKKEINSPEMAPWCIGVHAAHSVFIDKQKVN